ncbi:hypothetical protein [Streptomyces wuyuanensis]|uniref:hypothetical protein n=1 Tax=Streptomyces wuyuanensis TaxID=1196353 RepID=UPI003D74D6CB
MTRHEHGHEHEHEQRREDLPRRDVPHDESRAGLCPEDPGAREAPEVQDVREEDRHRTDLPPDGSGPRAAHHSSGDTPDGTHTTELYGPDGPLNDRTGKETVNDGPRNARDDRGLGGDTPGADAASGPDTPSGVPTGRDRLLRDLLAGSAEDQAAPAGVGPEDGEDRGRDELALRRLLQGAVGDLEPTAGALEHLRRAVPARRARKRQALVGMAASVILLGTAVPAFVHVASSGGLDDRPVNAGHGEQAQGGTGEEERLDGGQAANGDPEGRQPSVPGAPSAPQQSPTPDAAATAGTPGGTGTSPTDSAVASTPACEASQLGVNAAQAGAAEADGKVYGTFRISNVSPNECSIGAAGSVTFRTAGAADAAKISVVTHTTGDAASGLPDPSQEISAMVLKPEASYEVKFAFVPSETCPTTGASPDPTPTDGASGTTDGTGTASNTEPQLDDGTVADGSISVVHTPEPGGPNAEATIAGACAGTIYRTGLLNPS